MSGEFNQDDLDRVILEIAAQPRRRRLARDIASFLTHVPTSDDQPAIRRTVLMEKMGVCRGRVAYVAMYIRHRIPQTGDSLVSGPFGYRRTLDEATVLSFRRLRLGAARTTVITVKRVVEPILRGIERSVGVKRDQINQIAALRLHLDLVIQELELLT